MGKGDGRMDAKQITNKEASEAIKDTFSVTVFLRKVLLECSSSDLMACIDKI